ncbi:glycosyltransferase [Thalassospira sp.]
MYFMTSREEGGPMGLTESMACGVPVVSTAVGMAPDLLTGNMTKGLIVNYTAETFADAARRFLDDQDLIETLKSESYNKVQKVDWQHVADAHWEKVYSKLVSR